jgi:hypothetical protein
MPPEVLELQAEIPTMGKICAFQYVEDARKDFVQFQNAIIRKWSCCTSVLIASNRCISSADSEPSARRRGLLLLLSYMHTKIVGLMYIVFKLNFI